MEHLTSELLSKYSTDAHTEFISGIHTHEVVYQGICKATKNDISCIFFVSQMMQGEDTAPPLCMYHYGLQIGFLIAQYMAKDLLEIKELEKIHNASTT